MAKTNSACSAIYLR